MLGRAGLAERLRQERAVTLWKYVAGPALAVRSRALEERDGTLWVGVESAAWAAQLSFLRSDLLRRLQAEGATVAAIQFRLARTQVSAEAGEAESPPRSLPAPRPGDQRLAEHLASPLPDPRLAEAWRALVVAGLRRSRGRAMERTDAPRASGSTERTVSPGASGSTERTDAPRGGGSEEG